MNFLTELRDPTTGIRLQSFRTFAETWECSREVVTRMLGEAGRHHREMVMIIGSPKIEIRTFLEDWDSAIFWALVLFRPLHLPHGSPLRKKLGGVDSWTCAYEILENLGGDELTRSGLGLVYDNENNYLSIIWKEAFSERGILHGFERTECWKKVQASYKKRYRGKKNIESEGIVLGQKGITWIALRHSWTVPTTWIRRHGYIEQALWHRENLELGGFVTFAMNGVDVVRVEGDWKGYNQEAALLPPVQMNYVHLQTTDRDLYRRMRALQEPVRRKEERESLTEDEREYLRTKARDTKRIQVSAKRESLVPEWVAATRTICQLAGCFQANPPGKYPKQMSGGVALARFYIAADNYIYGRVEVVLKNKVRRLVAQLRGYVRCAEVPQEFQHWLILDKSVDEVAQYTRLLSVAPSAP